MPLPEMPGGIVVVVEQFGNGRATVKTVVPYPALEAARMSTGHEADPARLTSHAGGVVAGEPRPGFGETVDIGCF